MNMYMKTLIYLSVHVYVYMYIHIYLRGDSFVCLVCKFFSFCVPRLYVLFILCASFVRSFHFVCLVCTNGDTQNSFVFLVCSGWRRLLGCLEFLVIFRKRATNYRALLRKMTYEDKTSYDSTPPCAACCIWSDI